MRTRTATVIAAALLLGTLTACETGTEDSKTPVGVTGTATKGAKQLTPEQKASINASLGYPEEATPAQRQAYIAGLDAIDTDIAHGKEDKAISRGRDTCRTIKENPKDRDKQIKMVSQRFTSPTHPEGHGLDKAAKILDVVHTNLCPDF